MLHPEKTPSHLFDGICGTSRDEDEPDEIDGPLIVSTKFVSLNPRNSATELSSDASLDGAVGLEHMAHSV